MSEEAAPLGAHSKATTPNPKDLFGNKKVSISSFPVTALAHASVAMMDGREKYGYYNWREHPVIASIYVDAGMRHFMKFLQGQRRDRDSGAHELGHAIACAAILIDAEATGNLIDDRPTSGQPDLMGDLFEELEGWIAERRARRTAAAAA